MPSMASTTGADRPPKRMRLGTKSCAECRRRKVRCIYAPETRICKECILHDAVCVPQTASQASQPAVDSQDDEKSMRQRLQELEGLVRVLCKAVDVKADPSNPEGLELEVEALRRVRQASTPEQTLDSSSHRESSSDQSELQNPNGVLNSTESFDDAPLLHLFKAAMMIEGNSVTQTSTHIGLTVEHRMQACINSLNTLIPSLEELTLILETTEKYWPIWHAFPPEVLASQDNAQIDGVANVRNYILESMRSRNAVTVAKAVLCLALCVQQLPTHFKNRSSLPASPSALVDSYIVGAETLLPVNEGSAGTIDGLECFILQAKLYINMGKPRNAWLAFRRAMSYALLQGLHILDDGADERHIEVWNTIWQYDRNLSLILGLPYAVPDSHPGVGVPHSRMSNQLRGRHSFAILGGKVIDRNQNKSQDDYAATKQIEEQLAEYEQVAASRFLNIVPNPSMPLEDIYSIQTAKIFYHNLRKFLHLPYMLKSSMDPKYEHNRLEALDAAREMIIAWQQLRNCCGSDVLVICDLMDFQVFTAALVVILNLLSPSCADPMYQQASDWERVHEVTQSLQHVSTVVDCKVAYQAAALLENLSAAHRGIYEGPETYEAVIPYFGKVKIRQVRKLDPLPVDPKLVGWDNQEIFTNIVDFSADSFVPFSQNYMGDYLTEAELGVDWTAVLNADIGYEWSQSFNSSLG